MEIIKNRYDLKTQFASLGLQIKWLFPHQQLDHNVKHDGKESVYVAEIGKKKASLYPLSSHNVHDIAGRDACMNHHFYLSLNLRKRCWNVKEGSCWLLRSRANNDRPDVASLV